MKTIILTPENFKEIIAVLRKLTNERRYWLDLGYGNIKSADDPNMDWFRGAGTFERIVHLFFTENKMGYGLDIRHTDAINHSVVIPESNIIIYGSELTITDSDFFFYQDDKTISTNGGTFTYMEWTIERNEKYLKR